jgi:LmbE family N-acetylglucosaminyl deacetylase
MEGRIRDTAADDLDPIELGRRLIVLSPHLDDAVFSLGATIARAARDGVQVTVLTVFGGDPDSSARAGDWDRQAGFATEGEAAARRRREDGRACSILSATPLWQPFPDEQYEGRPNDAHLADVLERTLRNADTVLVPGSPLKHPDHRCLAELIFEAACFTGRIGLYVEQPYALWEDRVGLPEQLRDLTPGPVKWRGTRVGYRELVLKMLACRAYTSQLALMPQRVVWPMSRYEMVSRSVVALIEAR